MNAAIRGFLNAYKFKDPPYPTSLALVDSIRAQTPDSLKYLISDVPRRVDGEGAANRDPRPATASRRAPAAWRSGAPPPPPASDPARPSCYRT